MFNFFLPSTAAGQFTLIAGASIALLAVASIFYRRLQEQNRRLSTALNNMSQGLNMFDAQGRIILLNKRYLQMYKLSPDKPAGTQRNDRGRASGRGRKRFRRCRFRGQIACSANRQGDRRHSHHILAVQNSTSAVGAIRQIATRMQNINENTSAVAVSVEQQNSATSEISRNVASAAEGTGHVVSVLGDVAGAATQTRASAEVVRDASEAVDHAVADLRLEVEDFLGKVAV